MIRLDKPNKRNVPPCGDSQPHPALFLGRKNSDQLCKNGKRSRKRAMHFCGAHGFRFLMRQFRLIDTYSERLCTKSIRKLHFGGSRCSSVRSADIRELFDSQQRSGFECLAIFGNSRGGRASLVNDFDIDLALNAFCGCTINAGRICCRRVQFSTLPIPVSAKRRFAGGTLRFCSQKTATTVPS